MCDFCKGKVIKAKDYFYLRGEFLTCTIDGKAYTNELGGTAQIHIFYCPMCGKQLNEKNVDNNSDKI